MMQRSRLVKRDLIDFKRDPISLGHGLVQKGCSRHVCAWHICVWHVYLSHPESKSSSFPSPRLPPQRIVYCCHLGSCAFFSLPYEGIIFLHLRERERERERERLALSLSLSHLSAARRRQRPRVANPRPTTRQPLGSHLTTHRAATRCLPPATASCARPAWRPLARAAALGGAKAPLRISAGGKAGAGAGWLKSSPLVEIISTHMEMSEQLETCSALPRHVYGPLMTCMYPPPYTLNPKP